LRWTSWWRWRQVPRQDLHKNILNIFTVLFIIQPIWGWGSILDQKFLKKICLMRRNFINKNWSLSLDVIHLLDVYICFINKNWSLSKIHLLDVSKLFLIRIGPSRNLTKLAESSAWRRIPWLVSGDSDKTDVKNIYTQLTNYHEERE
jgi:hypothetical protein